jgi:glycosyltransferase involved in cell wall biosynthesis
LSSLGHKITLFCLVKSDSERKYVGELENFCETVAVFNRPEKPWTLTNILRTAFSAYPFLVIRNWAGGEKEAIEERLKKEKFDLIHAETFYVMPHIPETKIPILLVEQTIECLVYKHFVDEFPLFPMKPFLYIDVSKLKFWEKKFWSRASKVAAMSEEDKKTMKFQLPGLDCEIVPNGVDTKYFDKKVAKRSEDPIILYLGNFTWLQNREAVKILTSQVWPIIQSKLPKAKLWIIGKDAKSFFSRFNGGNVRVDEVSDVREVYQQASVLVAPIYGGGGTRYKNLESFASGLPVVTTSIGIGGTNARDGVEVIIRDKPEDIAKAAIELIRNPVLSEKLAEMAKKLVRQKYSWDQIANKLSGIYEELGGKQ